MPDPQQPTDPNGDDPVGDFPSWTPDGGRSGEQPRHPGQPAPRPPSYGAPQPPYGRQPPGQQAQPGQPPYAQPSHGQPQYGPPDQQQPYGQQPYGPPGQPPYGPPPGQPPYGQPPYGGPGQPGHDPYGRAPAQGGRGKILLVIGIVVALLLVIGGLAFGAVKIFGGDDNDSGSTASSSTEEEPTEDPSEEPTDALPTEEPTEELPTEEPTTTTGEGIEVTEGDEFELDGIAYSGAWKIETNTLGAEIAGLKATGKDDDGLGILFGSIEFDFVKGDKVLGTSGCIVAVEVGKTEEVTCINTFDEVGDHDSLVVKVAE